MVSPAALPRGPVLRTVLRRLPPVLLVSLAGLTGGWAATEPSGLLSLRRFELLDHMSGSSESSEINAYLAAVADSFEIANTVLASSGKGRLFCPDVPLDVPLMRRLLRERIAFLAKLQQDTEALKARSGVVIVILQALREKYPCR